MVKERQLEQLKSQQEKQLAELGRQRGLAQQRLDKLLLTRQALNDALAFQPGCNLALLQNQSHRYQQLTPAQERVIQEIQLLEQELVRIDKMRKHFLSRRQGLVWLAQQKKNRQMNKAARLNQSRQDEAGAQMAYRRIKG